MNSPTPIFFAPLAALTLLLCSCAVDTPQTRIERNPSSYESLTPSQRGLVEKGLIEKDMPKNGVLLALGSPKSRSEGYRNGASFERWTYTKLHPVYNQHFYGSYYGGRGYRGRGYRGYGIGFAPTIEYYPMRSATVWFRGDKVDSWERLTP